MAQHCKIDTLDGPADMDIRPGTQSGQAIPLYGQGSPHLNSSGRGDLLIHVTVETPLKLEPEQEELVRQLARMRGEESPPGRFSPGSRGSSPGCATPSTAADRGGGAR